MNDNIKNTFRQNISYFIIYTKENYTRFEWDIIFEMSKIFIACYCSVIKRFFEILIPCMCNTRHVQYTYI